MKRYGAEDVSYIHVATSHVQDMNVDSCLNVGLTAFASKYA